MNTEQNATDIDVEKIMEQIREQIKKKKKLGLYKDEEIKNVSELKLSPQEQDLAGSDEIQRYLSLLNLHWDPRLGDPIPSHRLILGPLLVFLKKCLRKILKPVTNIILARQAEFNRNLVSFFPSLTHEINLSIKKCHDELVKIHYEEVKKHDGLAKSLGNIHEDLVKKHQVLVDRYESMEKVSAQYAKDLGWLLNDHHETAKRNDEKFSEIKTEYEHINKKHNNLYQQAMILRQEYMDLRQENILQKKRFERIFSKMAPIASSDKVEVTPIIREKENLMDHYYFLFENKFRGQQKGIKKKQNVYLPVFEGSNKVLDIGCGRGEFLELLREQGVEATGIDINEDMIYICQKKKLSVKQADAFTHMESLDDDSLGGIFASHFIEHLSTELLLKFVALSYAKLKKGAPIVFETPNPLTVTVSATNFFLDLTHVKPIHPDAIKFLLESNGFTDVHIKYFSPYEKKSKLKLIENYNDSISNAENLPVALINNNINQLNDLLYGYQDYGVMGKKYQGQP